MKFGLCMEMLDALRAGIASAPDDDEDAEEAAAEARRERARIARMPTRFRTFLQSQSDERRAK
jgi:hypothetical protein